MLKMAKKRALVDAALLVASLSDLFTQDAEDMDFNNGTAPIEQPQTVPTTGPAPIPPRLASDMTSRISEKQARRMFAISNGNAELCRKVCEKFGYKKSADVKKTDYESICEEIAQSA